MRVLMFLVSVIVYVGCQPATLASVVKPVQTPSISPNLPKESSVPEMTPTAFDAVREKWRVHLTGGSAYDPADPEIAKKIAEIDAAATSNWESMSKEPWRKYLWPDIASQSATGYITLAYERLQTMTLALNTKGAKLENNPVLKKDIIDALEWMYQNRYNEKIAPYDNLWNLEIGTPLALNSIVVMLYDSLSAAQIDNYMKAIKHFSPTVKIYSNGMATGANRVWKCMVLGLRGIIVKDSQEVALARDGLSDVFPYVTAGDGFYTDGSFIQHTRHPNNGGYGASLIQELANVMQLLSGSPWDVTDPNKENVFRWVYDGYEPLIYKGAIMDFVRGREISRIVSTDRIIGHQVIRAIIQISGFASEKDALAFRSMAKAWILDDKLKDFYPDSSIEMVLRAKAILNDPKIPVRPELVLHKEYPGMDRVVHLRPGFGFAISMSSNRVYNYESINSEGLKSWYTGDGMTFLYNSDLRQYSEDYWPTVDPYHLPGTTVNTRPRKDGSGQSTLSKQSWVGGVDLNGEYGAAGMELQAVNDAPVTARKSWFMFDDEIVALGTGIASADSYPVYTTVENRKINPNTLTVTFDGGAKQLSLGWSETLQNPKWIHLDGVGGYYFPEGAQLQAGFGAVSSNWNVINKYPKYTSDTPVSKNYVSVWFDHGKQPANASYAYVILPNKTATQVGSYAANPDIQVIENSRQAQAIRERGLNILAVNFWEDAAKTVDVLTCDRKAAVMVREKDGFMEIAVSDPTQQNGGTIQLEIKRAITSVVENDVAIQVDPTKDGVKITVNVKGARGRTFRVRLKL